MHWSCSCDSLAADAAVRLRHVSKSASHALWQPRAASNREHTSRGHRFIFASLCMHACDFHSTDPSLATCASATADFHGRNMLRRWRRCLFIRIICNQSGHRRQSMPIINQRRKPPVKMIIYTTRECGLCNTVHGARWDDSVVCWFAALNLLVQKCMGIVCWQGNLVHLNKTIPSFKRYIQCKILSLISL